MRRGKSLELLVRQLESALASDPAIIVESPKFLPDKRSGNMREFDVVVTFPGHLGVKVALECRDRTAKVGSPAVEGFAAKCADAGVKGVVVSSTGFTAPALKKAASYTITCMSLAQATCFPWLERSQLRLFEPHTKHVNIDIETISPLLGRRQTGQSAILGLNRNPIPIDELKTIALEAIHAARLTNKPPEIDRFRKEYASITPTDWVMEYDGNLRIPILRINFAADVSYSARDVPLHLFEYKDAASEKTVAEMASNYIEVGDFKGILNFVRLPTGETVMLTNPTNDSQGTIVPVIE